MLKDKARLSTIDGLRWQGSLCKFGEEGGGREGESETIASELRDSMLALGR